MKSIASWAAVAMLMVAACGGGSPPNSMSAEQTLVGKWVRGDRYWRFDGQGAFETFSQDLTTLMTSQGTYTIEGPILRFQFSNHRSSFSFYAAGNVFGVDPLVRPEAAETVAGQWTLHNSSSANAFTTTFEISPNGTIVRVGRGDSGTWTPLAADRIRLNIQCQDNCNHQPDWSGTYRLVDRKALIKENKLYDRSR
jgi:hypothetical protein